MSIAARLAAGLVVGAVITLAVLPETRSLIGEGLALGTPSPLASAPELLENQAQLRPPKDALTRWQWLEVALARLDRRQKLAPARFRELDQILQVQSQAEPDNGYWPLARSLLARAAGDRAAMRDHWRTAARCPRWRDPQSSALSDAARGLGIERAWSYAALIGRRTNRYGDRAQGVAREVARTVGFSGSDLALRMASLRIGDRMREGARASETGLQGVAVAETATFPAEVLRLTSPRKLLLARDDFLGAVISQRGSTEADLARDVFAANDGWLALSRPDEAEANVRRGTWEALFLTATPGALAVVGTLAFLAFGLTRWAEKRSLPERFSRRFLATWAVFVALGVGFATGSPLAAIGAAACVMFLAWAPTSIRSQGDLSFGATYKLTISLLAALLVAFGSAFLAGLTPSVRELSQLLGLPSEYYAGSPLFAGLSFLSIGLGLLLAGSTSLAYRLPAPTVVLRMFADLARATSAISFVLLSLTILPILSEERRLREDFRQILLNEPLHYMSR